MNNESLSSEPVSAVAAAEAEAAARMAGRRKRLSRIAFAVSCALGIATGAWSYGAIRAAMDVYAGATPTALAGRENRMNAFSRSAWRLYLKLALPPEELAQKERFLEK